MTSQQARQELARRELAKREQSPTYKDPAEAFQKGGVKAFEQMQQDREGRITSGTGLGNKIASVALKAAKPVGANPFESLMTPKYTTGVKSSNEIPDVMAKLNPLTLATKPLEFMPQTEQGATQFSKDMLYGLLPTPTTIAGGLAPNVIKGASPAFSKSAQIIGNKATQGIDALKMGGKAIRSNLPKIMGERWFENQAKLVQKTASGLEKSRSLAYENIYNKLNKASVPQVEVSDILQKYDLIEELGVPSITDLKSLKAFSDELAQYVPQQIKTGKVFGKGGFANPKIRAEKAAKEIKSLIYKAGQEAENTGIVEKGITDKLKSLDKLARESLYPKGEKLRKIGGYSPEPETGGIAGAYKILMGSEGSAGQRLAIKRTPKALKELSQYVAPEKQNVLFEAIKNSKQLAKDMGSYRHRQILKSLATGGGLGLLANYLSRRMVGEKVLGGRN